MCLFLLLLLLPFLASWLLPFAFLLLFWPFSPHFACVRVSCVRAFLVKLASLLLLLFWAFLASLSLFWLRSVRCLFPCPVRSRFDSVPGGSAGVLPGSFPFRS